VEGSCSKEVGRSKRPILKTPNLQGTKEREKKKNRLCYQGLGGGGWTPGKDIFGVTAKGSPNSEKGKKKKYKIAVLLMGEGTESTVVGRVRRGGACKKKHQ